nr:hypothetical protein [uncultured Lachnoanaerobaculum sp.]
MADAILMAGGTGGVSSDDVTAGKAQVLQGYKTVTTDSNDEVVEGTIPKRGTWSTASEVVNASGESTVHVRFEEGYYNKDGQYKPTAKIPYAVLSNVLGIDANKMLDSLTVAGVRGTIPIRGYRGPNCTEIFMYQADGGYVVRIEEGYYHKSGQWKPYVVVPPTLMKSAVNYHPEKTLSDTRTCEEQGQVKMINTQDNGYTINQAKVFALDGGRGKLVMLMGHGNAYYHRPDGNPHVEVNASELGNAVKESVLQGQTASSQYGINFQGTIPRWVCNTGDVITAHNVSSYGQGFAWDDVHAGRGRGIVVGIPNRYYIQGANWVFLPSPNLYPWNIREGVNIHGIVGTMKDSNAGRVAFRNATFDGVLISGVANKGFILRSIPRFLNFKNTSNGYLGIQDGGMKLLNFYGGNTRHVSAPDVGCVFAHSINLSPFRYIKVGYKVFRFIGDGTNSQPARVSFEIGVTPVSNSGGESYNSASNTVLKDIGDAANSTSHVMTSTRPSAGDQSDHSQLYLTLDVSANQGHHFLYFMLGDIIHEYGNGVVSSNVVVNYIEFIN